MLDYRLTAASRYAGWRINDGEQKIILANEQVRLLDGTLAGSATNMLSCVKNAVNFGWPLEDDISCATLNPAIALGCDGEIGSIAVGKSADFIICRTDLELLNVYIAGEKAV